MMRLRTKCLLRSVSLPSIFLHALLIQLLGFGLRSVSGRSLAVLHTLPDLPHGSLDLSRELRYSKTFGDKCVARSL